ncbi:MAG TPA: NADH-quinone oxidoreductase subunit B family protein [Bacilli bacterium]
MLAVIKRLWKYGLGTANPQHLALSPEEAAVFAETAQKHMAAQSSAALSELRERLPKAIKKAFGRSLHVRHVDTGSCNGAEWELAAMLNPVYDVQRFGIDFVASPRHADMLLVTGGVTRNLEEALRKTYAATPSPKLVVAVGSSACGDDLIGETYANLGGVDRIIPVDVYVPGDPPSPREILHGILTAVEKTEKLRK